MITQNTTFENMPFLASTSYKQDPIIDARQQQINYNRKRGLKISRATKQNQITRHQLNDWFHTAEANDLTDQELSYFANFRHAIGTCCSRTVFRSHDNGHYDYIGAQTCNHKYCHVCNAERARNVRKTYLNFFKSYPELLKEYDFMHLTLTVPHSDTNGWRGTQYYANELMKEFNWMRKKPFWKKMVYAGEFGVEMTKNENGLHIHIHSMLLVRRSTQNRNELHKKILLAWNQQTADSNQNFKPLTKDEKEAILKSNKTLTGNDVSKLNRNGATLIGLESLYIKSHTKKDGFLYCERTGLYKKYVKPSDDFKLFMGGVLECIKYHFEPAAMKENGKVDFKLMREILPMIAGKPLYRKFGAFHSGTKNAHPGAQLLNLNAKLNNEKVEEILQENANEEVINPETLQIADTGTYTYIIVPMQHVYYDHTQNFKPIINQNKIRHTDTTNIRDALMILMELSIADRMKIKETKKVKRK